MPRFDVDAERINVFRIDDTYLFSHYFDRPGLFEELSSYYDDEAYRFEVPADDFDDVRERLAAASFDPVVVDDPESYRVVTEKYANHADILRNSVVNWERRGHRFFLTKDESAVVKALGRGADRLEETEFVLGV